MISSTGSSGSSAPIRKVRKAVLPAAGLGTRFLPATKAQPKEMLNVVDKPQIQYVVEECVASGIEHIIIVTGKGKNSIEDHFDYNPTLERFLDKKSRSVSATRCWWRKIWSAMTLSRCCWATCLFPAKIPPPNNW